MQSSENLKIDKLNILATIHHIFHIGENMVHGPSHLNFWLPYFESVAEKTVILVRNLDLYEWAKEKYPRFYVVFAKNVNDIDILFSNLVFCRNVYYSSNTGNTLHTLKFNELYHVFLGHGDSDKSASAHKYFRVYDDIWVAGQAHIDRFKNAGFNINLMNFTKIGRPSLRKILKNSQISWEERIEKSALYLPTWEGVYEESNYCSLDLSENIFRVLSDLLPNYKLNSKFHPVTGSRDSRLKNYDIAIRDKLNESNIVLNAYTKEVAVDDLIGISNIFICDISAVVSECLANNCPIFIFIPKHKEIVISKSDMDYSEYCYVFSDIDEFATLINEVVLNNNDYLVENRKRAIEYIISPVESLNYTFEDKLNSVSSDSGFKLNHILPSRQ